MISWRTHTECAGQLQWWSHGNGDDRNGDGDSDETYTITLGTGSNYMVGTDNTANGTITVAMPMLTLATNPATVAAGENISLTVTSDITVAGSLMLPLTIAGSGITAADFTNGVSQTVNANFAGSSTATVMIATVKDGDSTAETYTITLGGSTGYTVGSDNTATGVINTVPPTLTLVTNPATVTAGESISLLVTSDIMVPGTLTLSLSFSGQVVANDFTANTVTPSISANFNGSSTATVMIATARDGDPDETYTITLGTGTGYTVGSNSGDNTATGTISAATPTLRLATDPVAVSAGEEISLTVTSDITVAGTLMLPLILSGQVVAADITGGLTQTVNANFAGTTSATVTIGTAKDGDPDETYTIMLGTGTGYTVGSNAGDNTAAGMITAVLPELTLATDPAAVVAGNDISLVVNSDIAVTGSLMLPLSFSGQVMAADITGGLTQTVNANFNGSTTATVTIATARDGDPDETYTITLGTGTGYTVGSNSGDNTAMGIITAATPTLRLASDPAAVSAGEEISLTVTSDITVAGSLMLSLAFSGEVVAADITGGLTQTISANFAGTTTATVLIATVKDADANETYTITLGTGTGYTVGSNAGDNTAAGMITMATATLTLATDPADVAAGEDISLEVTSDIIVAGTLTLSLTLSGEVVAADISGGLSQMPSANFGGTTTATVTIATVKDNDAEEDYTITLATDTGYTAGSPAAVNGTITAVTPELTLATDPVSVAAGGNISLTVTSDTIIAGSLTLPLTLSGEVVAADISGGLSQMPSANFNGSTTATVTIATVRDGDAAETYTITLGTGSGYTVGSNPGDNTATGMITAATPSLRLPTAILPAVSAGNNILVPVSSDIPIAGTLTLQIRISDRTGGRLTPADFTAGSFTQSINVNFNGGRNANIIIGTVIDGDTSAERFTVRLNSGIGYTLDSSIEASFGSINPR